MLLLALVLGFGLVGCDDAEVTTVEDEEAEDGQESDDSEESDNKDGEEEKEVYSADETVSVDGLEASIESVTWGEQDEYSEVENDEVLRIELSFENNSDDSAYVDDTEFSLSDGDGNMAEEYWGNDDANSFSSDIKKGKKSKGILEFDVPESDTYELHYEPDFGFSDVEVKWEIEKDDIE